MKVVVAHNRYSSAVPSGENMVVDAEITMLREAGVEVIPYIKSSDSLDSFGAKVKASTGPVWAPATRELARLLDAEKPDVLHLHNVYPLISPWAVRTAKTRGVAVVQTMHNYRHQCVAGQHLREGRVCESCGPKELSLPAIRYGCYRGSHAQSAAMVLGRRVHRSTWKMVDRYLALSPFMAQRLIATGIHPAAVSVRPTTCADPGVPMAPTQRRLLFVGRLEEAKGIRQLLAAWTESSAAMNGWSLALAGSGPLEDVARQASAVGGVVFLGRLSLDEIKTAYADCAAVVVPSIWFEGYPRVVAEAFGHGRGVIASDLGSLGSIVPPEAGAVVRPWHEAWVEALSGLDLATAVRWGSAARLHFLQQLTEDVGIRQLLGVYESVSSHGQA